MPFSKYITLIFVLSVTVLQLATVDSCSTVGCGCQVSSDCDDLTCYSATTPVCRSVSDQGYKCDCGVITCDRDSDCSGFTAQCARDGLIAVCRYTPWRLCYCVHPD